jgi:hypothetical protein
LPLDGRDAHAGLAERINRLRDPVKNRTARALESLRANLGKEEPLWT